MRSTELKELHMLALQHHRLKHPTYPEEARYVKPYSDRTANELTKCIIDHQRFTDNQGERVSVTGRYIDRSRIVSDTLGHRKRIGSGMWIPSSMQKGSADISAIIKGRAVKIEIKMPKDSQSAAQKLYQNQVERAGGLYWIIGSFAQYMRLFQDIS